MPKNGVLPFVSMLSTRATLKVAIAVAIYEGKQRHPNTSAFVLSRRRLEIKAYRRKCLWYDVVNLTGNSTQPKCILHGWILLRLAWTC